MGDFLVPEMFTRPTEEQSVSATLPVPCGSGDAEPAQVSGPRVNLSLSCGDVGEPLIIRGHELPPNEQGLGALGPFRWRLSAHPQGVLYHRRHRQPDLGDYRSIP